jgi:hypothetical protein
MRWSSFPRISPALVVASVALFVSLAGGAYAAFSVPRNSVGTRQLRNGSVTGPKVRNGAVTASKVRARSLLALDFAPGQLVGRGTPGPRGPRGFTGARGARGATGSRGATGARGATGSTGATGPGFHFTSSSGNPGPTLSPGGTDFVVVETSIAGGATPDGACVVSSTNVGGAFARPASGSSPFSFSGMVAVGGAAVQLSLSCHDTAGGAVAPGATTWWVSQVG